MVTSPQRGCQPGLPSLSKPSQRRVEIRKRGCAWLLLALIALIDGDPDGDHLFLYEFEMEECLLSLVIARPGAVTSFYFH